MSRVQAVTFSGLMLLMREPLEDMVTVECLLVKIWLCVKKKKKKKRGMEN
jgi:hypothetical protein